jgi:hypothetical protein
LGAAWSSNKTTGVRSVKVKDSDESREIVMKRYELDFATEFESESHDALASFASNVDNLSPDRCEGDAQPIRSNGKENPTIDEDEEAGSDRGEECEIPGTSMLVGKVCVSIFAWGWII